MKGIFLDAIWKMKKEAKDICEKYDVPVPPITINTRLRTTAGRFRVVSRLDKTYMIEVAGNLIETFGVERGIKTFRHEMAHYLAFVLWGDLKHSPRFKKLCAELEGTMNPKMAGYAYAQCATDEYVSNKKYKYTCKCGASWLRVKKIAETSRCRCGTVVKDMKFEYLK